YPDGNAEFTNTYTTIPTTFYPSANKTAVGASLSEGQFEFAIYDSEGNEISVGRSAASSSVDEDE
ncbi:MAG: hypothetical protein LBS74_07345, partial [Oscillospiraceae bacterium]|nr:hypothetical protein [Oscillospiraceae bacterium]